MTAIAAKFNKKKTKIVFGCDSQTTIGSGKETPNDSSKIKSKIVKIDNTYIVATAGKVSETSLFQRYCQRTKPKGSSENDIFDFMVDFKEWISSKDRGFIFSSNYIIYYKNKLFSVKYGYQVEQCENHASGGAGTQCINVAFNLGSDVKTAIKMAIKHDIYCGGKIEIVESNV